MKTVSILRWIAVLPAAAAGCVVAQLVGTLCSAMGDFSNEYVQFINSIIGGVAFVYLGAKTAPQFQFAASICLAVLYAIGSSILGTMAFSTLSKWQIVCLVAGILAALFSVLHFWEEQKPKPEPPSQVTGWN